MQIDDRYTPPYGHVGLDPPTFAVLVVVHVETYVVVPVVVTEVVRL